MEGPGYLAVTVQPGATTVEADLDEWYNNEHGPLRLRLPYITSGDRYKAIDGKQPCWLAVYDVKDLSWLEKREYTRLREERSKREQQVMGTFSALDRRIYEVVETDGTAAGQGSAPLQLTESFRLPEAYLANFQSWLKERSSLLPTTSRLRTRTFHLVVPGLDNLPPDDQIDCRVVHDFENADGLQEYVSAQTESTSAHDQILVLEPPRLWSHHTTFEALKEPPSSVITTDGAELRFQIDGNPADPVIVLVNSILTNIHIWDDVASELCQGINGKTYRVLRYNARGYSQQWSGSRDTSFDILADDLEYLLSRLRIDKVVCVVGVSMGGVTAINFALKYPALLQRFVACDCNVAASPSNNQAWADRIELAKTKGMSELAKVTAERWFTPAKHDKYNFEKVVRMIETANMDGFEQNANALCNYDLRNRLEVNVVPGLLVAGEQDGKLPQVMQKFGIPNTTFRMVEKAGHLPMLENHDAFMTVLTECLT